MTQATKRTRASFRVSYLQASFPTPYFNLNSDPGLVRALNSVQAKQLAEMLQLPVDLKSPSSTLEVNTWNLTNATTKTQQKQQNAEKNKEVLRDRRSCPPIDQVPPILNVILVLIRHPIFSLDSSHKLVVFFFRLNVATLHFTCKAKPKRCLRKAS